ncbi:MULTISPECIES: hypothetical protein [unclassified Shinella]|uniref:hypothetical protein n=1 Tax=Shinella TaxID=323620 RepID=UPI00234F3E65|nr:MULTISPECIES: hypothetical protein [unclassified Shinella]MCO5140909.1 hypothetical protein [Shinella sp.]MCW5711023.1 hypothetical protein [Shinella sp.]MDC7257172.1 hypothetical protein [Shinella sp. YE25]
MFLILDPAMLNHPATAFVPNGFLRAGFISVPRSAMGPNGARTTRLGWTWLKRHAGWHPGRVVHENGIF